MRVLSFAAALFVGASTADVHGADDAAPSDPCTGVPLREATIWASNISSSKWLRSGFFEECLSSLRIDKDNLVQHINSLSRIFEENYAFFDLARDPPDSDPKNHQPELGYTIYSGENQGQLDIKAALASIIENVEADDSAAPGGASLSALWDVKSTFNLLRDGHNKLPGFPPNSLAGPYEVFVFPERSAYEGNILGKFNFTYSSDGDFELKVLWQQQDSKITSENIVSAMNGMSPYEFVEALANSPGLNFYYQAIGARINEALGTFKSDTFSPNLFHIGAWVTGASPSKIFPSSFNVTYTDGTYETYYVGIGFAPIFAYAQLDSLQMLSINRTSAEASLAVPGKFYQNYITAINGVERTIGSESANNATEKGESRFLSQKNSPDPDAHHRQVLEEQFEDCFNLGDDMNACFRNDYAFLQIKTFSIYFPSIIEFWSVLMSRAEARGVKKLIIDISYNGGGLLMAGMTIITLMFPELEYKWFEGRFDRTYNEPMRVYDQTVLPIVSSLFQLVNETQSSDLQSAIDTLPIDVGKKLSAAITGMKGICTDADTCSLPPPALNEFLFEFCYPGKTVSDIFCCSDLDKIDAAIHTFNQSRSPESLVVLVQGILQLVKKLDPLGVQSVDDTMRVVRRGGTESSLIYTEMNPCYMPKSWHANITKARSLVEYNFDEFIVLSNGVAGSTSAIFSSFVHQLAKNKDRSEIRSAAITVGYGFSTKDDMTMAGWPASNQDVYLEYGNIIAGSLFILNTLIPNDLPELSSLVEDAFDKFEAVLPPPPYFGESHAGMAIFNYYDSFMNPGALPLQYVKMTPDEYIALDVPMNTVGYASLYDETSKYFSSATPSTPDSTNIEQENKTDVSTGNGEALAGTAASSVFRVAASSFAFTMFAMASVSASVYLV